MSRHMERRPIATIEEWFRRLSTWVGGKWIQNGDIRFRYYGAALCQIFEYEDRQVLSLNDQELEFSIDTPVAEIMMTAFVLLEPPTRFLALPETNTEVEGVDFSVGIQ